MNNATRSLGSEERELTGPELGVGDWATVNVAKFRGAQVAVKRIHNQIISRHNIELFQRVHVSLEELPHSKWRPKLTRASSIIS